MKGPFHLGMNEMVKGERDVLGISSDNFGLPDLESRRIVDGHLKCDCCFQAPFLAFQKGCITTITPSTGVVYEMR